jgi:hypothetical protein
MIYLQQSATNPKTWQDNRWGFFLICNNWPTWVLHFTISYGGATTTTEIGALFLDEV